MRRASSQKVQQQAHRLRSQHPELFEYLVQRDRQIQSALSMIPDPEDTELSGVFSTSTMLQRRLNGLAPGVGDLSGADRSANGQ